MNTLVELRASLRDRWARLARLYRVLRRWPWLETLKTLRQRFREDRLGLTAGSLTFTTTIALVPLFTVTLAVFTAFPMFSKFQGALEQYFIQSLVPDAIARQVLSYLTQFAVKAKRLGTVGLVVLVFTALALMLTIDRALNGIWRVRKPRPIAQRVLVYWAAATLGPLLLGVSLTITSYLLSASKGIVGGLPGGMGFVLSGFELVMLAAGMACLYHYVPNAYVEWRHAWVGGVFVAGAFELAKSGLAWYLEQVPTYSNVYGAFATVPIFLIWLYAGWVIVLLGAVIAAYAPSLQMRVARRPSSPGARFGLAIQVIRELAAARAGEQHGLSLSRLAEILRTDPLQIDALLEALVALDWVGGLAEEGGARYVLLCDPQRTSAEPLVARLLLDPTPSVTSFWRRADFARMNLSELL